MRDAATDMKILPAINPVQITDNTAEVGPIIDLANFDKATFNIQTGTLADADATFTALLDEGDAANLSDAAAVADADLVGDEAGGSPTFADDDECRTLGYIGSKRYVRLTITPATNTGLADVAAQCILSGARKGPQATGQQSA